MPMNTTAAALTSLFMALCLTFSNAAWAARKVEQIETPSGIKVWLVEEHAIPLISIRFAFDGGALQDPRGKEGLTSMLSSLLTEAGGELTAEEFARRLADEGSQLSITAARVEIYGGLDALTKRFAASAELLRMAFVTPRFDMETIERLRQQKLSELELAANEPRGVAFRAWFARSFPDQAYGRPIEGNDTSVRSITATDLRDHAKQLLAKSALKIVMVGDIGREDAIKAIDRIFGDLPAGQALSPPAKGKLTRLLAPVVIEKEQPLATAAFGAPAVAPVHADFPAWQVLIHIIGSGDFDSTLMDEIRVKRGLAYAVSISLLSDQAAAVMLGGMATKNENMGEALSVLREVLARTASNGPTSEQLENAKQYLTGSYLLDFDTNAKLAGALQRIWIEGRGPEFVEARNELIKRVTLADVKRVARAALAADAFNITIVGKPTLPK